MKTSDRRAFIRAREHGAYVVFPGGGAKIRDVSVGGVMLDDEDPLHVGSPINLEMHLGGDTLYCEGVVRRCEPASGMAVQFQRLSLPTRESLLRHVNRAGQGSSRQKLDASVHEYRLMTTSESSPAVARPLPAAKDYLAGILIRFGIIDEVRLGLAQAYQRRVGGTLVTALVSSGVVAEDDLVRCFAREFRLPVVDLATIRPTTQALRLVSHEMAVRHTILPIGLAGSSLTVAIADPANHDGLRQVKFSSGCDLRVTLAPARTLLTMIDRVYATQRRAAS